VRDGPLHNTAEFDQLAGTVDESPLGARLQHATSMLACSPAGFQPRETLVWIWRFEFLAGFQPDEDIRMIERRRGLRFFMATARVKRVSMALKPRHAKCSPTQITGHPVFRAM